MLNFLHTILIRLRIPLSQTLIPFVLNWIPYLLQVLANGDSLVTIKTMSHMLRNITIWKWICTYQKVLKSEENHILRYASYVIKIAQAVEIHRLYYKHTLHNPCSMSMFFFTFEDIQGCIAKLKLTAFPHPVNKMDNVSSFGIRLHVTVTRDSPEVTVNKVCLMYIKSFDAKIEFKNQIILCCIQHFG